jgi:hypothetical protein
LHLQSSAHTRHTFGHGALDAALDRLMMQSERPANPKKRQVFPISQQYPRPLDPARRFGSRLRYRSQLRCIRIPSDNSIARRHAAMTFHPVPL